MSPQQDYPPYGQYPAYLESGFAGMSSGSSSGVMSGNGYDIDSGGISMHGRGNVGLESVLSTGSDEDLSDDDSETEGAGEEDEAGRRLFPGLKRPKNTEGKGVSRMMEIFSGSSPVSASEGCCNASMAVKWVIFGIVLLFLLCYWFGNRKETFMERYTG